MKRKHILFIVENAPVPEDIRVWNEAQAVRELGYEVSIICPIMPYGQKDRYPVEGIRIYRHPRPPERSGKWSMILEYLNALFWESLLAASIFMAHPFQGIHGANPPDHIFLISIPFKLFGVRYIFDHHDIVPENYAAKYKSKGLLHRVLLLMEWATFKTADMVISTNESYRRIAIQRGGKKGKDVVVVRNAPNPSRAPVVSPNLQLREGFTYLVGYVGIIGQQEGIENLLKAASYIIREKGRTDIKFIIVGSGPYLNHMIQLSRDMGLEKCVHFTGFISREELNEVLTTSDVCVNPEFRNEFTDKSTMIKLMEYMMFGKPIVQFYTQEGEVTAGDAAIYVRGNDIAEFADMIMDLLEDPTQRSKMGAIGRARIEKLGWAIQKKSLKDAYQRIFSA